MVLHDLKTPVDQLPRPAIRPYPVQYVMPWRLKNKTPVVIRPIKPEDEPLMVKFHETLSEESVYHRYFSALKLSQRVAHERLTRICFNDYDREIALVSELKVAKGEERKILGVGRLSKLRGVNEAEFAVLISDDWQDQGLGSELLKQLVQIGRDEKLDRLSGQILLDNHAMQHLCRNIGFKVELDSAGGGYLAQFTY